MVFLQRISNVILASTGHLLVLNNHYLREITLVWQRLYNSLPYSQGFFPCQQFCLPSASLLGSFSTTKCMGFMGFLSFSKISTNNHLFLLPFFSLLHYQHQISLEVDSEKAETGTFNDDTCQVQNKYVIQQRRNQLSQKKLKKTPGSLSLTDKSFFSHPEH